MKVSQLGQFGMIDTVAEMIEKARDNRAESWKNLIDGIGDDCAVWKGDCSNQLAKVDCQIQGVHFNLDFLAWEDLGWKALAVNLSDIASMGGKPSYALVSLGLPLDTEVEDVVSLYRGMLDLAVKTGTALVGGNMSSSPVVFVDVNVIGKAGNPEGKYLKRSTARPGDLIAVTGWLGTAAAGLEMLSRKIKLAEPVNSCLKQAFSRPEPRLPEGRLLIENGVMSCIDISDGLIADLGHICQSSHVGAVIEVERLPVREEVLSAFGQNAVQMALSGGEDYQLLFTASPQVMSCVQQKSAYPVTIIGKVIADNAGQVILMDRDGKMTYPGQGGWDHFKRHS